MEAALSFVARQGVRGPGDWELLPGCSLRVNTQKGKAAAAQSHLQAGTRSLFNINRQQLGLQFLGPSHCLTLKCPSLLPTTSTRTWASIANPFSTSLHAQSLDHLGPTTEALQLSVGTTTLLRLPRTDPTSAAVVPKTASIIK